MSAEGSLKDKAKVTLLTVIQAFFVLMAIFSMIGVIYLLMGWFLTGYEISILEAALIYLVIFILSIFPVTYLERELRLLRPKREGFSVLYVSNVKWFMLPFSVIAVAVYGFTIVSAYFQLFPSSVSDTLRLDILRTIIQSNGFLIGLTGIVFAQMFWAINNQQNALQMDIIQNPKNIGYPNIAPAESRDSDVRRDFVMALDRKRRDMSLYMFFVIGAFIVSIALSLREMARTELYQAVSTPTYPDIIYPIQSMIIGIVFFVIFIVTSKMSLAKEDEKPSVEG